MSGYRWNAGDYARHSGQQLAWAHELIAKLDLSGDEDVLDVGCGDGKVTAQLASRVPRGSATGVDVSPEMIDFAQQTFSASRFPNLRFAVCDASTLRFNAEFDLVFSNASLHWIRDHTPVLRGIASALRAGGRGLIQMGGRGNAAQMREVLDTLQRLPRWAPYFEAFEFPFVFHAPEEYATRLQQAGLEPCRVELLEKDMIHAGREGLSAWVRSAWLPFTMRVPEELRTAFVDAVSRSFVERHPEDAAGKVHVRMVRLEVEFSKPARRSPGRGGA